MALADIDEIPKPWALTALRNCDWGQTITLHGPLNYYSFQWKHPGQDWARPLASVYTGDFNTTVRPEEIRHMSEIDHPSTTETSLQEASWHCSCCFKTVDQMLNKMVSFSHTEWDKDENRRPDKVVQRVREGLDVFGREIVYERVPAEEMDYPAYLKENKDRFSWMLDRDGQNAGFVDFPLES